MNQRMWTSLETTKLENMHTEVFDDAYNASKAVAVEIAELIRRKAKKKENCVLGLATGSTPIKVYDELIRMHREEALSFENVISFNLDEYYGLGQKNVQSYVHFMNHHLFDHVDIQLENIHIPDGTVSSDKVLQYCIEYDAQIEATGGLDFQLLGIGRTGHIGFNEPGSRQNSTTRLVTLDHLTRQDNAYAFDGIQEVPKKAITMGVATILGANRIVIMALGEKKADIVRRTIEGEMTSEIPATFLQLHNNVSFILDEQAASELTRFKTPWMVGDCNWNNSLEKKAVAWLSEKLQKPILKLTDRDYNNYGMSDLLGVNRAYDLNVKMFSYFQHTITGWPGGKPGTDDSNRPERAKPAAKRVIIFSPHPDDDVISMGGTFLRLVDQGHEVHVAYQTSGNTAVADHEVLRFTEFARELYGVYSLSDNGFDEMLSHALHLLKSNSQTEAVPAEIRKIKALIRRGEAKSASRYFGIPDSQIHFLDLPFYETGRIEKNPLTNVDISIIEDLIAAVKPHQIYAAGDLADPHGTHETCLKGVISAIDKLKGETFMKDCWLWLYRGAWQEYPIDEIEMAVPLSPDELEKKRLAIWRHQSQKDGVVFQGEDSREFWERVEDRNKRTAVQYNNLGLAEYEAIEAFKRYHF